MSRVILHRGARRPSFPLNLVVASLALIGGSTTASATSMSWVCNGSLDWNNSVCWSGGPGPQAGDDALIVGGGASGATAVHSTGTHVVKSLTLNANAGSVQLTVSGGSLSASNSFAINNASYLQSGGTMSSPQTSITSTGSFQMNAGSFDAVSYNASNLVNQGTFSYSGGTLSHVGMINTGTLSLSANMTLDGLNNSGAIDGLGTGRTLTINSGGFSNNYATVSLTGGTVAGIGSISNVSGAFSGYGSISGSGTFTNSYGTIQVTGGTLAYAKDQALTNSTGGQIHVSDQATLSLPGAGNGLVNNSSITLAGSGTISGGGFLQNGANGSISGNGTINLFLQSQLGTLQANAGQKLTVTNAFSNGGRIVLAGSDANAFNNGWLQGGTITNLSGASISGTGALSNNIVNQAGSALSVTSGLDMVLLGSFDAQAGSSVQVPSGARLFMDGPAVLRSGAAITGPGLSYFGSTLNLGVSPGQAFIEGGAFLASPSVFNAEIGGTAAGTGYDKLSVGQLELSGGTLRLSSYGGFVAQAGQSFDILDFSSEAGSFGSIDSSGLLLAPGTRLDTSQLYVDGTLAVVAVPEPATWLSLGAGLLLVAGRRRRFQAEGAEPCATTRP